RVVPAATIVGSARPVVRRNPPSLSSYQRRHTQASALVVRHSVESVRLTLSAVGWTMDADPRSMPAPIPSRPRRGRERGVGRSLAGAVRGPALASLQAGAN